MYNNENLTRLKKMDGLAPEVMKASSAQNRRCRFTLPTHSKSSRLPFIGIGQFMILLATFFFTGCAPKPEPSKGNATLPTAKVRVQTIESTLHATTEEVVGTVRAKTRATLEAKVSGRITTLPVVLGQPVKAGELVVRLDAPEIVARRDQAEASLQQAGRDWKRMATLVEQQAVARAEYEAADTRCRVARARPLRRRPCWATWNWLRPLMAW